MGPITFSHLGSDFLLALLYDGRTKFEEEECLAATTRWVEKLSANYVRLEERLIAEKALKKRTRDFLKYCTKKGIIKKKDRRSFIINTALVKTGNFNKFHENPVQYSVNEFNSLLKWHEIERP